METSNCQLVVVESEYDHIEVEQVYKTLTTDHEPMMIKLFVGAYKRQAWI